MLITRRLIDAAGPLDPAYGAGYGEENDLSMRALDLGLEIACCDDVYVHHAGSVSFGPVEGISEEREANRSLLERRWPDYSPRTSAWTRANPLRPALERINARAERRRFPERLRVLHVLHRLESRGGIEEHTRALVEELKDDVVSTIAYPRFAGGAWADFLVERSAPHLRVAQLNPDVAATSLRIIGHPAGARDSGVERAFGQLLEGDYDVVHVHSPIGWNTLALAQCASQRARAVVVTAHDFSMLCADYNMMIGTEDRPCGRAAARGSDAGCVACLRGKSLAVSPRGAPLPIADYIEERYAAASASMESADAIVCPSAYVARRIEAAFPTLRAERIRVVAHGVQDLAAIYIPREGPILRAAYLGSFTDRKGAAVLVEAMRRLAGQRVSLEAWGPVKEQFIAPARETLES
jgi:glycosyltransferase involved in cell wall biosynthesis